MQHQRDDERIEVDGRVSAGLYRDGEAPGIELVNISHTGAALMAEEPIGSVPERAQLRMRADDGEEWVSCDCELRYILGENRPDGEPAWLHGVRFTDITPPVTAFIDRLFATCRAA